MKQFFQKVLFLLDSNSKKKLPFLFLLFLSSSVLDVIGIGLVLAFLSLIVNFHQVLHHFPMPIQHFLSRFGDKTVIFFIGIGLVFAFIFKGYWGIYSQRKLVYFTSRCSIKLKMRLMRGYQYVAYPILLQKNAAYSMNKISLVDNFISNALSATLNGISSCLVIIGVLFCLLIIHPWITIFLIIMTGSIFFLYDVVVKSSIAQAGKTMSVCGGEINKSILQALGGLKEIRILGKEPFFLNKVRIMALAFSQAYSSYASLQLIPRYAVESAASIFLVVLVLGALFFDITPVSMIPTLGVFAAACIRLLPSITQLIGQVSQLRGANYATNLLHGEVCELEKNIIIGLKDVDVLRRQPFFELSLRAVSFSYPESVHPAIENINLSILYGQSVGFVGASGAGKSTLIGLILGLLSPSAGNISVDQSAIENLRLWLNNFAYIPQSIFLLDDMLKHNIALGVEDSEINHDKLNHAIEMAQLSAVVSELPDGLDTIVGENGVRLSGGQRQRVALARAFYFDREVIIMDEATSSLDNETEREVIHAIKRLHGVKTLIVIAHRLSTIQHCDVIYKLEKGKIVAKGSFDEVVGKAETITRLTG